MTLAFGTERTIRTALTNDASSEDVINHLNQIGVAASGQRIIYVDSGSGSNTFDGLTSTQPKATLAGAIATAAANDIIVLQPGHAETHSSTGAAVTINVAGLRIVGLGVGAGRPTFTFSHTGATWTWSAASVLLSNVLLVCGIDSVVTPITISGPDAILSDVELRDTTDIEFVTGITTTADADRLTIERFTYNGYTGGNAAVTGILLIGVNKCVIRDSHFDGLWSTAAIEMKTTACTKVLVDDCTFLNTGTSVTKDIVDTQGSSTWRARRCFDNVAGYAFEGGNAAALMYSGGSRLYATKTTTSPLPNNTTVDVFNYIGLVAIHELAFRVSTAIQNQATAVKFQAHGSSDTSATDMCGTKDIDNFVVDSVVRLAHDAADAAVGTTDVSYKEAGPNTTNVDQPHLVYGAAITSAIKLHSAAASTGAVQVWCIWEPLSPGARLVPA